MKPKNDFTLMSKALKGNGGFTLIEVLLVGVIGSVVGILLISILVQNNGLFSTHSAQVAQGVGLNDIISEVSSSIKTASSVAPSYPSTNPTYISSTNTLVLSIPSIDASGNPVDNTLDFLVFTSDNQNQKILRELLFPDLSSSRKSMNKVLATTLSSINFSYSDLNGNPVSPSVASKISYTVNLSTKAGYGTEEASASSQAILRNN